MCKNSDRPCPGCTRHATSDAASLFLTEQERHAAEHRAQSVAPAGKPTDRPQ